MYVYLSVYMFIFLYIYKLVEQIRRPVPAAFGSLSARTELELVGTDGKLNVTLSSYVVW